MLPVKADLCTLSVKADEFHKKAQQLLDWLADAERQLRYKGSIPDEELLILQQMEEHKVGHPLFPSPPATPSPHTHTHLSSLGSLWPFVFLSHVLSCHPSTLSSILLCHPSTLSCVLSCRPSTYSLFCQSVLCSILWFCV